MSLPTTMLTTIMDVVRGDENSARVGDVHPDDTLSIDGDEEDRAEHAHSDCQVRDVREGEDGVLPEPQGQHRLLGVVFLDKEPDQDERADNVQRDDPPGVPRVGGASPGGCEQYRD